MVFALCACGSESNTETAESSVDPEPAQIEVVEKTLGPTPEQTDDAVISDDNSDEPWKDHLPDGINAEIQFIDEYTGFVIFYNETGEDISLETNIICSDENYDILGIFGTFGSFVRNGEKHIDIIETTDPIFAFQIDCSIGNIRNSVQEDNDAISMTSSRNSDGSVTVEFVSSADYVIDFFATIFYVDAEDNIIGYETSSPQFIYDMGGVFNVPDFEYYDYFILLEI